MCKSACCFVLAALLLCCCGCSLKPFGIAPIVIVFGRVEMVGAKTETNNATKPKKKTPEEIARETVERINAENE